MKYLSRVKGEKEIEELSRERARLLLERIYEKDAVDDIFDNDRGFCLQTMTREIWTQTDDGLVPQPGFYGIIG